MQRNIEPQYSAKQAARLLHNAKRPGQRKEPGEQGLSRSFKRIDYTHCGAVGDPNMCKGHESDMRPMVPRTADRSPHIYQCFKDREEPAAISAGVRSGQDVVSRCGVGRVNREKDDGALLALAPAKNGNILTHEDFRLASPDSDAKFKEGCDVSRISGFEY